MPVKRRKIFYIPGYDPIPPRRYRELYRSESAAQAKISGYNIGIKPSETSKGFGWAVDAKIDGVQTQSEVEVLIWSDIVRRSMTSSIPGTYLLLIKTAWIYISTGALRQLMRLRKGPIIAALYPIAILLLQLLAAVLLALAGFRLGTLLHFALGYAVALVLFVFVLRWFRSKDNKIFAYYLMHDYAYSAASKGAMSSELRDRLSQFSDQMEKALHADVDEVLIIGHSSGAHLAVSVLAQMERAGRMPAHGPAIGFLSLGQVVPMVSFLPNAWELRADLRDLSTSDKIAWVDVTAPGDGCAFALCDPVKVSGVAPDNQRWPLVFSAAFTQSLSPARWKTLRRRYFRLHFQYLCAFDRPKDYDYFQITAGPLTLAERYKDRPASRSRIEIAASPYTSVAL
jgi:hypothetical protein